MASSKTNALTYDKSAKAAKRARLGTVIPCKLNTPEILVRFRGRLASLVRAREAAENAEAFAQLVASDNLFYCQKLQHKLEKATKKLMLENARLVVHYEAAEDRARRIEEGIPALDTKGIYLRRLYRATAEREFLHSAKTAMKYSLAANLEAMRSLQREAEAMRGKFTAKAKGMIYQFMRGLSRGKTDLSLLSEEHIDSMLSKSVAPISAPDVSKYENLIREEESR